MEHIQLNLKKSDKKMNKRGQLPHIENSHMIDIIKKINSEFKMSTLNA